MEITITGHQILTALLVVNVLLLNRLVVVLLNKNCSKGKKY